MITMISYIIGGDEKTNKLLEIRPLHDRMSVAIEEALSKYSCIIPAVTDLPNPPKGIVNKKYYLLDRCIFVPKALAESQKCGGLQLFRNIKSITGDSNFCTKSLGKYVCYIYACVWGHLSSAIAVDFFSTSRRKY